jgi:hypothetical protein
MPSSSSGRLGTLLLIAASSLCKSIERASSSRRLQER